MTPGDRLTLSIEKPAAGGRMIARHEGAVVLVSGAIPGETVDAEIEKIQRGVAWARTRRVLVASHDRVGADRDPTCGGSVLAHVAYDGQLRIKREIIVDTLARIGHLSPPGDLAVLGSPVDGYRMRARLHVAAGRVGFFREGTHELCDAASTRQLLPESLAAVEALAGALVSAGRVRAAEIELAENCAGDLRAAHVRVPAEAPVESLSGVASVAGFAGVSWSRDAGRARTLWGIPEVTDHLVVPAPRGELRVELRRHPQSFFQGNRYLLVPLASAVLDALPSGWVMDLYAGVGLFSAVAAARGDVTVVAVEADAVAAGDARRNAVPFGDRLIVRHELVERFLESVKARAPEAMIVDPPRTGLSRPVRDAVAAARPGRIVYVSCDIATLARDARALREAGYRLHRLRAFDLFPNTAHVETVAVFDA